MARRLRLLLVLTPVLMLVVACATPNGPYALSIAPGLAPRLKAYDAVRITRAYLDRQTPQLAAPGIHTPAQVTAVWAVDARNARTLDGCIPRGDSGAIVWITEGVGDYLNLEAYPWSDPDAGGSPACAGPGTAGTIAIDDATGAILGVWPTIPTLPHPSPDPD